MVRAGVGEVRRICWRRWMRDRREGAEVAQGANRASKEVVVSDEDEEAAPSEVANKGPRSPISDWEW